MSCSSPPPFRPLLLSLLPALSLLAFLFAAPAVAASAEDESWSSCPLTSVASGLLRTATEEGCRLPADSGGARVLLSLPWRPEQGDARDRVVGFLQPGEARNRIEEDPSALPEEPSQAEGTETLHHLFYLEDARDFPRSRAVTHPRDGRTVGYRSIPTRLLRLNDGGFENGYWAFALAEPHDDGSLRLRYLLEPIFAESIGTLKIDSWRSLGEDRWMLFGRSAGGDAGETWGSTWAALLDLEEGFRVLHREAFYSPPEGGTIELSMDCSDTRCREIAVTRVETREELHRVPVGELLDGVGSAPSTPEDGPRQSP